MPRTIVDIFVNLSDADAKRRLMRTVATLSGLYDVSLKPRRATRSNAQNRYYFGVVLAVFVEFMLDQGEEIDAEQAHEFFKLKFLRSPVVNKDTGEVLGQRTRSTTDLNTVEFNDYLERVVAWQADKLGIVVPDPNTYSLTESQSCRT